MKLCWCFHILSVNLVRFEFYVVVFLGTFVSLMICTGTFSAYGVLTGEFMEEFKVSATESSWMAAVDGLVAAVLGEKNHWSRHYEHSLSAWTQLENPNPQKSPFGKPPPLKLVTNF